MSSKRPPKGRRRTRARRTRRYRVTGGPLVGRDVAMVCRGEMPADGDPSRRPILVLDGDDEHWVLAGDMDNAPR